MGLDPRRHFSFLGLYRLLHFVTHFLLLVHGQIHKKTLINNPEVRARINLLASEKYIRTICEHLHGVREKVIWWKNMNYQGVMRSRFSIWACIQRKTRKG